MRLPLGLATQEAHYLRRSFCQQQKVHTPGPPPTPTLADYFFATFPQASQTEADVEYCPPRVEADVEHCLPRVETDAEQCPPRVEADVEHCPPRVEIDSEQCPPQVKADAEQCPPRVHFFASRALYVKALKTPCGYF